MTYDLTDLHLLLTGGAIRSNETSSSISPGKGKRQRDSPDMEQDAPTDRHPYMRRKRVKIGLAASPALSQLASQVKLGSQ